MARLIPKVEVETIKPKPERDAAAALISQLPDNVLVYHSYPWLNAVHEERKTTLNEGEADFVIVIPELGFLVIEVKGGTIDYDNENRRWFRRLSNGHHKMIKDPFEQARRNTHALKERILLQCGGEAPRFAFGHAVFFPDCDYEGTPPPGADQATILTARDLPHLDRRIPAALRKWSRRAEPTPIPDDQLSGLKQALNSTFRLLSVLTRRIEEEEEGLVRLTDDQFRFLDFIQNQDRCLVEGVAGSGKTLLAFEQASRFAHRGLKTLLVCYNRALARWLRSRLDEKGAEFVDVYHFHGLCYGMCREAGLDFNPPDDDRQTFFREIAPDKLLDAIAIIGTRYDAVVVDEGQDFYPEWWPPLEFFCHRQEHAPFYLFYDPAQNLFVDEPEFPDLGRPFPLTTNCRNTRRIAEFCGAIHEAEIRTHRSAPDGTEVRIQACPDAARQVSACDALVKELRKGGVAAGQIVIQSPYRKQRDKSSFRDVTRIGGFPVVSDFETWKAGEGILFSTIRSFKGLEADVVIMVDVPKINTSRAFSRADCYVGASRARHVLAILSRDEGGLQPDKE